MSLKRKTAKSKKVPRSSLNRVETPISKKDKAKRAGKQDPLGYHFNTKYDPKFCLMLLQHARNKGGSFQSFAAKIGVCRDTLSDWAKANKDFGAAKNLAKEIQESCMVDFGIQGMGGRLPAFHQAAWIFYMKARFNWKDTGPEDQDPDDLEFDYGGGA